MLRGGPLKLYSEYTWLESSPVPAVVTGGILSVVSLIFFVKNSGKFINTRGPRPISYCFLCLSHVIVKLVVLLCPFIEMFCKSVQ